MGFRFTFINSSHWLLKKLQSTGLAFKLVIGFRLQEKLHQQVELLPAPPSNGADPSARNSSIDY
jgi:hypothetical protein